MKFICQLDIFSGQLLIGKTKSKGSVTWLIMNDKELNMLKIYIFKLQTTFYETRDSLMVSGSEI